MILLAGGTGTLGALVVQSLTARGLGVRVLTRDPRRADHLKHDLVEVVVGDVRDAAAMERAMSNVQVVISAIQGFSGQGSDSPRTVDFQGNVNLIRAAQRAQVEHFILVSVQGAALDHPMELHRMKYQAEQELQESGLSWTIIRPTASMETWVQLIGAPLVKTGRTVIFGRGVNPINFVSMLDVARVVERVLAEPNLRGTIIEVGGPENLSFEQVLKVVASETGRPSRAVRVPPGVLRVMAAILPRLNPTLARQVQAALVMDSSDMTFVPASRAFALSSPVVTLNEVVRRTFPVT